MGKFFVNDVGIDSGKILSMMEVLLFKCGMVSLNIIILKLFGNRKSYDFEGVN